MKREASGVLAGDERRAKQARRGYRGLGSISCSDNSRESFFETGCGGTSEAVRYTMRSGERARGQQLREGDLVGGAEGLCGEQSGWSRLSSSEWTSQRKGRRNKCKEVRSKQASPYVARH